MLAKGATGNMQWLYLLGMDKMDLVFQVEKCDFNVDKWKQIIYIIVFSENIVPAFRGL